MKLNVWSYIVFILYTVNCVYSYRYAVNSDQCRIPEPRSIHIDEFHKIEYESCTTMEPLTNVAYDSETKHYALYINENIFNRYIEIDLELNVQSQVVLKCCYMAVRRYDEQRVGIDKNCTVFESGHKLPNDKDSFIVQCHANEKLIYTNAHATVPEREHVRKRLDKWTKDRADAKKRATSVLLIGIDTVSRINLRRAMPKTYQYLNDKGWFEMDGYNKVADNTFPNMVPMTTGINMDSVMRNCNPRVLGGLDRCQFVWKDFEKHGYVTSFGEDDTPINTFNFIYQGFKVPPVDYYLRPYLMAAENFLDRSEKMGQSCLGFQHESEHVYNYALEFAQRYGNDSFFGFFWTNSHSHGSSISRTSAMDVYTTTLLERLVQQGTMEQSVVILVSDHGLRYGPARASRLGWLEERLPFLYIWLPPHLKQSNPEFVLALEWNRHRLTSPYDLYLTLMHILELSSPRRVRVDASDCRSCQSLLKRVPANRACSQAGIPDHWCTCWPYKSYKSFTSNDNRMANMILRYVKKNIYRPNAIKTFEIQKAYVAIRNNADDPFKSIYRLQLKVWPGQDLYEGTVSYSSISGEMVVSGVTVLYNYSKTHF